MNSEEANQMGRKKVMIEQIIPELWHAQIELAYES